MRYNVRNNLRKQWIEKQKLPELYDSSKMKYSKLNEKNIRSDIFFYHKSNYMYFHFQDLLEKRRSAKKLKHTSFCSSIVDALIDMTYELVSLKVCIKAGSFTGSDLQFRKKLTIAYQEESFES